MPGKEPMVSVVVTTKNASRHFPDLLADFARLDWPPDRLEILLVDAFSTDGTWTLVQDFAQRAGVRVVAAQHAGFIGAGRNEGFRRARGEFVAVTDADMRVPPSWIRELVAGLGADVGVVGGPNESATTDLASRCVAAIPTHGPSVGAVPLWGRNKWHQDYATDHDVYAAVTRNALFRKAAFDQVGGFDESLRVTEDPELMHRILKAGWRIQYRRAAAVQHVHRDSFAAYFRQQRLYAFWQAHVNRKHPELGSIKQRAPAWAFVLFLVALGLGFVQVRVWLVAIVLGLLALLSALAYGVRAAVVKRDAWLALAVPAFFLVWQAAWVFGYPMGALRARRGPRGASIGAPAT